MTSSPHRRIVPERKLFDLEGRVAVVTGSAGPGLGQAIARKLLSRGACVAVTDRHAERTEQVAAQLADEFPKRKTIATTIDVTSLDDIKNGLEMIGQRLGAVDVVVNNAAINLAGSVADMRPQDWDRVIAVNLTGPWLVSSQAFPIMQALGRGVIVNIGSVAGYINDPMSSVAYTVSKAGLRALTRKIASEGGPYGIRCNGVDSGTMNGDWLRTRNVDVERFLPPVGFIGEPEEVANAVAFLVSDESSYITGETLPVSGGFAMHP